MRLVKSAASFPNNSSTISNKCVNKLFVENYLGIEDNEEIFMRIKPNFLAAIARRAHIEKIFNKSIVASCSFGSPTTQIKHKPRSLVYMDIVCLLILQ